MTTETTPEAAPEKPVPETVPETAPDGTATIVPGPTVLGPHDLSDHPALAGGTIRNVGDTVLNRDINAPSFKRPPLQRSPLQPEKKTTES
jgi:hypothetical protein